MARYIDADNFRKTMTKRFGGIPCLTDYSEASRNDIPIDDALSLAPTADVVPKSEVERLQEALSKAEADVKNYIKVAEYQQSLSVKRYHEIKRLKEDIERLEDINERDVENLRLAKAEVARDISGIIEQRMARNIERMNGCQSDIWKVGYLAENKAYQDIKEIIEQKYTEVAE